MCFLKLTSTSAMCVVPLGSAEYRTLNSSIRPLTCLHRERPSHLMVIVDIWTALILTFSGGLPAPIVTINEYNYIHTLKIIPTFLTSFRCSKCHRITAITGTQCILCYYSDSVSCKCSQHGSYIWSNILSYSNT